MAAGLLLAPHIASAQLNVTFDCSQLGDLTADQVFVTFAGFSSTMTIGGESINFSDNTTSYNGMSYVTSQAYSLQQIESNKLTITSANSMVAYISYESSAGIALQQANPVNNVLTRYSTIEFSYSGSQGTPSTTGGIDMTNISQYGGSLKVETLANGNVQAYVSNGSTLTTGQMFCAMAAQSNYSPAAVIQNNGQFVRIIGGNVFTSKNPYPTFNDYLGNLYKVQGTNPILQNQIMNLAPNAAHGGQGAIGVTSLSSASSPFEPNTDYNIDYQFSAQIIQQQGNYGVTLTGSVYATPALGGDTITIPGLTVNIPADSSTNPNMTNFLYLNSITNPAISVTFNPAWQQLIDNFGADNTSATMQQKVTGDFGEAIAAGFVNSSTLVEPSGSDSKVQLGTLTTWDWFNTYNQYAYSLAQPTNDYYNTLSNITYLNSPGAYTQIGTGQIGNGQFSYGSVYGAPYDDRFGLNLITPDSTTDTLHVILLPDDDLTVPRQAFAHKDERKNYVIK